MTDELKQQLLSRGLLGGSNARIGPKPEPSMKRKALELFTGFPADPDRELGPMDAIQMLLLGTGLAKGAKMWGKKLIDVPHAKPGQIAKDPYGLSDEMDRRGFVDRLTNNPAKRLSTDTKDTREALREVIQQFVTPDQNNPYKWFRNPGLPTLPHGWLQTRDGYIRPYVPGEKTLRNKMGILDNVNQHKRLERWKRLTELGVDNNTPGPVATIYSKIVDRVIKPK